MELSIGIYNAIVEFKKSVYQFYFSSESENSARLIDVRNRIWKYGNGMSDEETANCRDSK